MPSGDPSTFSETGPRGDGAQGRRGPVDRFGTDARSRSGGRWSMLEAMAYDGTCSQVGVRLVAADATQPTPPTPERPCRFLRNRWNRSKSRFRLRSGSKSTCNPKGYGKPANAVTWSNWYLANTITSTPTN